MDHDLSKEKPGWSWPKPSSRRSFLKALLGEPDVPDAVVVEQALG